jgi:hypothetical protein
MWDENQKSGLRMSEPLISIKRGCRLLHGMGVTRTGLVEHTLISIGSQAGISTSALIGLPLSLLLNEPIMKTDRRDQNVTVFLSQPHQIVVARKKFCNSKVFSTTAQFPSDFAFNSRSRKIRCQGPIRMMEITLSMMREKMNFSHTTLGE